MTAANAGGNFGIGNRFWSKDYRLYFASPVAFKWLKSSQEKTACNYLAFLHLASITAVL